MSTIESEPVQVPDDRSTDDQLWVGVGSAADPDIGVAAQTATGDALHGRSPSLVLVFTSADGAIERALSQVCADIPDEAVLAGCSSMAQIGAQGPLRDGVVVVALGAGFEVATEVATLASADRRLAGEVVAAAGMALTSPHRLMMMLCDGLTREQHTIVRGAYSVLGPAVPLVGGCAADDLKYVQTFQYLGTGRGVSTYSDSVVGIGIGADRPFFSLGIEHGWQTAGEAMVVTNSSEGWVYELDGLPAAEVYLDRLGLAEEAAADPATFRDRSFDVPLGISRRNGADIRVIHALDHQTGALQCLADVPQGSLVWLMTSTTDELVDAGVASCSAALERFPGDTPSAVLLFDCGARHRKLGEDGVEREVRALHDATAGVPAVGLYTMGEIARMTGSRGMHHLTCVALALG